MCKDGYPFELREETLIKSDGYPLYRRRNWMNETYKWYGNMLNKYCIRYDMRM